MRSCFITRMMRTGRVHAIGLVLLGTALAGLVVVGPVAVRPLMISQIRSGRRPLR